MKFGRRYAPDERDRLFAIPRLTSTRVARYWSTFDPLDQGQTSQCVAYSTCHWLLTAPVRNLTFDRQFPNIQAFAGYLYKECQFVDEWPGEDYEGTSVRAAFKLLKQWGYVSEYRWAWDAETVALHVLEVGPVVVGTNWYGLMMSPSAANYLELKGEIVGGHAYMLTGFSRRRNAFRVFNSWGRAWGQNGRAWLRYDDFQRLLKEQGEACTATEVDKDPL